MIKFDDVRRTTEETLFFFPNGLHQELAHFLTRDGFTEDAERREPIETDHFRVIDYATTRREYPNIDVPLVPGHPVLAQEKYRHTWERPIALVSHLSPEDMSRKLWEIHDSDEAREWRRKDMEELHAEERARAERLRGWGPGLTRESEDAT